MTLKQMIRIVITHHVINGDYAALSQLANDLSLAAKECRDEAHVVACDMKALAEAATGPED
jgi:hypothetical protein